MTDLSFTLSRNFSFPSNISLGDDVSGKGGRIVRQSSGHAVVYGSHGRRILASDPDGNVLHECEWSPDSNGIIRLTRARFRLDWGQWVGLKPAGLINSTILDLSRKPGWQQLRPDDLRRMAAQALRVSLDEVRLFYSDDDLTIDTHGHATIRHKKDAFYILSAAGTFEHPRFMACMGAMHWDRIDFLPVVELFQSLLPGTGSAAFELIRGLYDDQNRDQPAPLPLRYRGIPTYPSEAAFRLFSGFFVPRVSGSRSPFDVFMNPSQSGDVTWLPSPTPPRRYFDPRRHLCITLKDRRVYKVTLEDDSSGLSYQPSGPGRRDRTVSVFKQALVLRDAETIRELAINDAWGPLEESTEIPATEQSSWRQLFVGSFPVVKPHDAFSAVLLYPDDASEIDEVSSQPFVADYVHDLLEESRELVALRAQAHRTLVENFDGALHSCLILAPTEQTVVYTRPAFAQKYAQTLWTNAASPNRRQQLAGIRFITEADRRLVLHSSYDWMYDWIPFASFAQPEILDNTAADLSRLLTSHGHAFVVGPSSFGDSLLRHGLRVLHRELVETLPTFRMHQSVLPLARIKPGLTLYHVCRDRLA